MTETNPPTMSQTTASVVVLSGPNGAGNSTAAPMILEV
jgi:ABC-type Mn2+/Zn2+ transport system ATPase subunit